MFHQQQQTLNKRVKMKEELKIAEEAGGKFMERETDGNFSNPL